MSGAKHTPGPWVVQMSENGGFDIAAHRTGSGALPNGYCVLASRSPWPAYAEGSAANARLIAAAPDLAFDLLAACNYIDALGGDSTKYRQTYAKATGEAQ